MAAFKLPRLKSNLAIVNGQGRPTDFFLRLFNIDMAQRLETIINDQQAIIDAIVAAQQAAQAAQDAADAAQDTADQALQNTGARYTDLNSTAGTTVATSTVTMIKAQTRLQLIGGLLGGTLDADAAWNGEAEFFESDGTTTNSLGVMAITTASSGLAVGGEWQASDSSQFTFDVIGSLTGTVEYSVWVSPTGGSNYVQGPSISSVLTITPRAV